MNYTDFSSSLHDMVRYAQDHAAVNLLLEYCAKRFGESFLTDDLGVWEFSEFVQILQASQTEYSSYYAATCSRRCCRVLEDRGMKFKTSPVNWKCPPKPDINHFDPLSRTKYEKLCSYLDQTFKEMRERLCLIEKAKGHKSAAESNGSAFSSREKRFYKHQITLLDMLSSLIKYYPDFPIDCEKEAFEVGGKFGINQKKVDYSDLENEVKLYRKRFTQQRIKGVLSTLSDYPNFGFQDVLDILVPSEEEVGAIRKAICLETGWSPDLVARINPRDFTFQDIDPESDYVFLKTIKVKGTQRNNNYTEATSMFAPSSKSKPDSAFNLVKLWLDRTESLRKTKAYAKWVDELGFEPFLIAGTKMGHALMKWGALRIFHPEAYKTGKNSSGLNSIYKKKLGFTFDERQLRPTNLYYIVKKKEIPFALAVTLFGHSDSTITDEFYQSGSHFEQDRKDRLGKILSEIEVSISDGSFAGELIPLKEHKTVEDKIFTIFSDHSNQNPVAVCSDPYNPSWPGYKSRVPQGARCRYFSKCLLCSRSQVFSDNLPFVVDRYLYLEKQKRTLREDHFSIHLDEYNAAKNVVDSWPYEEEVEEAKERTFTDGFILPPILLGDSL